MPGSVQLDSLGLVGTDRLVHLNYPFSCAACGMKLDSGTLAYWDIRAKPFYCVDHEAVEAGTVRAGVVGRGNAGAPRAPLSPAELQVRNRELRSALERNAVA